MSRRICLHRRFPLLEHKHTQANQQEQRWQQAAAALGPADRQIKFLRMLGAKGAAAAAEAGSAPAGIPPVSGPSAVQDGGNPDPAANAHKVKPMLTRSSDYCMRLSCKGVSVFFVVSLTVTNPVRST